MECIKEFLHDSYQSRLRLFAQGKSERYEDTIQNYAQIFIAHLSLVKKKSKQCKTCKNSLECSKVRDVLADIEEKEINTFFNQIKEIYIQWIDSKIETALKTFEDVLKDKQLLNFERKIKKSDIFFKGRKSKEVLTKWDMFHIPFNKRHLIENQRYSLTGQPMLYIGNSIIGIAKEIDAENLDEIKISVIRLSPRKFKIYNLKNDIIEDYRNIIFAEMLYLNDLAFTKAKFFRIILSSICSFQRRQELKGFSFCEEYVLPQMLALILKNHGYDGIAYMSTQKYQGVSVTKESSLQFKENIAIFTKFSEEHVYDKELFDKISISVPIDTTKMEEIKIEDLTEICNEISARKNVHGLQELITSSESIRSMYCRIYNGIQIDKKEYSETKYGKFHLYELYSVLNEYLVGEVENDE